MIAPRVLRRWAQFSPCRRYRYQLGRHWGQNGAPLVLWIMLNPSTADDVIDDATILDITTRTWRWSLPVAERDYPGRPPRPPITYWPDVGGLAVVNLYGLRSTDPQALRFEKDPIGPDNDEHLQERLAQAAHVVCAWGNGPRSLLFDAMHGFRVFTVFKMITAAGHAPYALDVCKSGMPRHPLYWPAAGQLFPYSRGCP